jgi:hypothetical protein
MSTLIH